MSETPVEIEVHEDIEAISEQIKQSTFEAYITLEGVFQGVERIIGEQIPSVIKEITEKTRNRCLFTRLSLRRKEGKWDELVLLVCNKVIVAAHGVVDNEELSGQKCLERLAVNINKNQYSVGIIELTELPVSFVEKRLGVGLESIGMERKPEEAGKRPRLVAPPKKGVEELVGGETEIKPSVTIPVETSIEQTKILTVEEARRFLPPTIASAIQLPGVRPPQPEEEAKVKAGPMKVGEIISIDKPIIEISDKMMELSSKERINILQAVITGGYDELIAELMITKLGLTRKRAKMLKIAKSLAEALKEELRKNNGRFKKITVIVTHGYDAVKVSTEL